MTNYDVVYKRFAQKITDYGLADLPEVYQREMCLGWLHTALAKFKKCKSDLSNRDDDGGCFVEDLLNEEIEILAILMVTAWLDPQVNSVLLTNQFYGGKEENFFSQSKHLDSLSAVRDKSLLEAKKLMRDYNTANSTYLHG